MSMTRISDAYTSVNKTTVGSFDVSAVRRMAFVSTNADLLWIWPLRTNCFKICLQILQLFMHHMWVGVGVFSKVVATLSHVGGSFNLFMATTGDAWIIPSFRIWDYVLHVEHVSCVITNCGQHQWVIPSPLSIALKVLLEENTTRKLLSLSLHLYSEFCYSLLLSLYSFYRYLKST